MTPVEHAALIDRAAKAIITARNAKQRAGGLRAKLTAEEAATAVVSALYGEPREYFTFDDQEKKLVAFEPKGEKAA